MTFFLFNNFLVHIQVIASNGVFYKNQLGLEKTTLFENRKRGDFVYGYTENHIKVKAAWNPKLGNTVHKIRLTRINRSVMLFDLVKDERPSNRFVFIWAFINLFHI